MKLTDTCLQLDCGNSGAKWRLLRDAQLVSRGRCQLEDSSGSKEMLSCTEQLDRIWVASVASEERNASLSALLEKRWGVQAWFARTPASTGALQNSYAEPERMGVDRWLAMLGASQRTRGRFAVVDAGSALTVDIVDACGVHEGGYIIPGPELMERALLLDTDRVRFAADVDYALEPGRSTAEAVRHGIAAAQAGAVSLILRRARVDDQQVLLCGGGAKRLIELLGIGGAHAPDLVFEGLELLALDRD